MSDPYAKVQHEGHTLDRRTLSAFLWADKRFRRRYPKARLELAQGGYNPGGVAASAGTHDLGAVIDVRTVPLTAKQARWALRCLKRAGFAAWIRDKRDGMPPHIHAVLIGHRRDRIAPLAAAQVGAWLRGRNGLANDGRDRNPWRPAPVRWSHKRGRPVPR